MSKVRLTSGSRTRIPLPCRRSTKGLSLPGRSLPLLFETVMSWTVGDYLRKRRLDLGLRQRDVARFLHVDPMTVNNWERDRTSPNSRLREAIITFLGSAPSEPTRDPCRKMTLLIPQNTLTKRHSRTLN